MRGADDRRIKRSMSDPMIVKSPKSNPLASFFAEARPKIDAALAAYTEFASPADEMGRSCPAILREAMRYSLLAPGKRLRPMLALLAARACGGTKECS